MVKGLGTIWLCCGFGGPNFGLHRGQTDRELTCVQSQLRCFSKAPPPFRAPSACAHRNQKSVSEKNRWAVQRAFLHLMSQEMVLRFSAGQCGSVV